MFGFVKPLVPELKVKDSDFYKSVYCGLCRSMSRHTGGISTFTLSYDMTFFALCRMALSDTELSFERIRCKAHPMKKRTVCRDNAELEFAARASGVLVYYNCKDNIADEKGLKRTLYKLLLPYARRINKKAALPDISERTEKYLCELSALEKENCPRPDEVADVFGKLLGELIAFGYEGERASVAREIGFHTGRWVYLADAVCDYKKDLKEGKYNPFIFAFETSEAAEKYLSSDVSDILTLELCALDRAIALIDPPKADGIMRCITNIVHGGMENSLITAMRKEAEK